MQICTLVLGIFLAGQLSDSGGTRYAPVTPPVAGNAPLSDVLPVQQQPWDSPPAATQPTTTPPVMAQPLPRRSNPLRATAPAAAPARSVAVTENPADLFRRLAKPIGAEKLRGTALSLTEAVQNLRSRSEQTDRVKIYWELSQAVTEYHLATVESVELQSLRNNISQPSNAWQQTQQTVAARRQVAHDAVKVAQLRLAAELRRPSEALMPLPSDLPYCGVYESRYDQIFQGRSSQEAKQLSDLLPLRFQELGQQAIDTQKALELLTLVDQQRSPQSDGAQLLHVYEQLALQRRVFVTTAYQYNSHIVDYTHLAVPQNVGTVRLVSMLIPLNGNLADDRNRGAIQRASAEEPISQNRLSHGQPRTFAAEGRSETRRVPVGEHHGERSILVPSEK